MVIDRNLDAEFEKLKYSRNYHSRGRALEALVAEVFRRNHFSVIPNAAAARPRQSDLFASLGKERYLVEVKWTAKPADVDVVASLRDRLRRTSPDVVGVLVSVSGFTSTAVVDVVAFRTRPILLVDGPEIERLFWRWPDLRAMLRVKAEHLMAHGATLTAPEARVYVDPDQRFVRRPARFVLDGERVQRESVACSASRGSFVFVQDLPDIDYALPGHGVDLDLVMPPANVAELRVLLGLLKDMRWTSALGRWSFRDDRAAHLRIGIGDDAFLGTVEEAVAGPEKASYDYIYFDTVDSGFYVLVGSVRAGGEESCWTTLLSFHLDGIPLDSEPLRHLAQSLELREPPSFRPRSEVLVTRHSPDPLERVALTVVGQVAEPYPYDGEASQITGIVARNPFWPSGPDALPAPDNWPLLDVEYLLCTVRCPSNDGEAYLPYMIDSWEVASTPEADVVRVFVDRIVKA